MAASTPPTSPPPLRRLGPGVAGLFSLLVFASLPLVPILGAVLALLAPLPLVHLFASGRSTFLGWGWVAAVMLGAALALRTSWAAALCLGYLLVAAWPAWSVEVWSRRAWSPGRWLAVVGFVALTAVASFMAVLFGAEPAVGLEQALVGGSSGTSELMSALAGGRGGEELMAWAIRTTAFLAPAIAALYVTAAALWLRPRLPLLGLPLGQQPFARYTSEEWLPLGFALGGLAWVFAVGPLKWLGANVLGLVLGLYFVHGLAIIHFHLGRKLMGNRWVRLAVAFFALQMPLAVIVAVMGLADSFFQLRRGDAFEGGNEA